MMTVWIAQLEIRRIAAALTMPDSRRDSALPAIPIRMNTFLPNDTLNGA